MKMICLANSRKHGLHCVAGLALPQGTWVRPISSRPDGALPREAILVAGQEPRLLEVLDVPISPGPAPDFGFQPENRLLGSAAWSKERSVQPFEIFRFCESLEHLLHNDDDRVPASWLKALPPGQRRSLQLVNAWDAVFRQKTSAKGKPHVRAAFTYTGSSGRGTKYDLVVTDPAIEKLVLDGEGIRRHCVLTVSLGMPYSPDGREDECYKLVAGVVEL
jgi:hypothetical protein